MVSLYADGDYSNRCPECGRFMPPGATFCLCCGAYMNGRGIYRDDRTNAVPAEGVGLLDEQILEVRKTLGRKVRGVTEIMLTVWVALSLVMGMAFIFAPGNMAASAYAGMGGIAGGAMAESAIVTEGLILVASGVCAAVGILTCERNGRWWVAFLGTSVAAVLPLMIYAAGDVFGLLFFFAGVLVAARLARARWAFSA